MKLGLLLTTHTKSLAQTQLTIIISPRGRRVDRRKVYPNQLEILV